jgi:imidazolonepropionase-like amidohydrolase
MPKSTAPLDSLATSVRAAAASSPCPCCALSALPGRRSARVWPAALDADRRDLPRSPAAPSFSDQTPAQPTRHAQCGDANTRDLYEDVAPGQWIVVRGGDVLTMTSSGTLRAHDVLVRDGVIRDVRPAAADAPEGAIVVEAQGRFVIPGLAEMHTHPLLAHSAEIFASLMEPEVDADALVLPYDLQMFLQLAAGVTRIEIMAGTAEELALRDAVRAGRFRGPAMRVASPVIDGPPPMQSRRISWVVGDAEGGRRAAREIVERGYDFAKPYTRLGRDAFVALAEECGRLGVPLMGHVPKAVGIDDAIALGQLGIAHAFEFFCYEPRERRRDAALLARRAERAARLGVTVQATLCAAHVFEYQCGHVREDPRIGRLLDPVLAFLMRDDSPFLEAWRRDPELVEAGRDIAALSTATARALFAAGVRVLPGTDLPGCNVTAGYSIHEELRLLVEDAGVAARDVLRAATVDAAAYHGEAGRAGAVAAGQRGDLVVVDRDPTQAISATREIDTVVAGRTVLRREARERGLARARARYAAMPVPKETPAQSPA